jgi:integrase/recombinase XerD
VSKEFPVLKRFQQDLKISGLYERTQESYVRAVRKFSDFLKRQPDTASEDELRTYLLHIQDNLKWSRSTINVAQNGIKRFYKLTCPREWPVLQFVRE